jgi:hypothetical protein
MQVEGVQGMIITATLAEYADAGVSKRNLWDFMKLRIKELWNKKEQNAEV